MIPEKLANFIRQNGTLESFPTAQVFHSQQFTKTLFLLERGYAKRYQVSGDKRVIELIYGPGYIFPLTQLYEQIFGINQNQDNLVYVYEGITDIELYSLDAAAVLAAVKQDHDLYIDLYYESGLRLKSNIDRLASNALSDDYKKVAHQLVCLADEFGVRNNDNQSQGVCVSVPLTALSIAEQLNISEEVSGAIMSSLCERGLLSTKDNIVSVPSVDALKDVYL